MGGPVRMQPFEPQEGLLEKAGRALSLKNVIQGQQLGAQHLEENRMALDERRQFMQKQMAISQAWADAGGNFDEAIKKIMQIDPEYAMKRQTERADYNKKTTEEKIAQHNMWIADNAEKARLLASPTDQASFEQVGAVWKQRYPDEAPYVDQMLSMGFERAKPMLEKRAKSYLGFEKQLEENRKQLEHEQDLKKTTAEATMAGQEALLTAEQRAELKRGRIEVPGVDFPYSADVEAQKKRLAAAGRAPAEDTQSQAEDYADSLERGTLQWSQVPAKVRGNVTSIINKRGSVILNTKQREALQSSERAESIINSIDEASKRVHSGATVPGQKWVSGLAETATSIGAPAGNPDLDALQSGAAALGPIIRNLGEMGNLSEGDIARALAAVPVSRFLTRKEAKARLSKLREFVSASRNAVQAVAGKTSKELFKGAPQGGTTTVRMRAPNGQESDVSPNMVEHYKSVGAVVVR